MPIAHAQGNYYIDPEGLSSLTKNNQIVFRYCNQAGLPTDEANPNGSLDSIAGICNKEGTILGMMPHPERASDAAIGVVDGLRLFGFLANNR